MIKKILREAGRMISAKNESHIRTAHESLSTVISAMGTVTEAERSYDKHMQLLDMAVHDQFSSGEYMPALVDVFDTSLVYFVDDMLYQVDYQLLDNDAVVFGIPAEVIQRVTYEPVPVSMTSEAAIATLEGDVIPLIEKAVSASGTAKIKIIQPGWGSSGFYSKEVLQRDGPKVFGKGTHMYLDHPTESERRAQPERSVQKLAAVTTSNAQWQDNGPDGAGLYADIKVKQNYKQDLEDIAENIGVSIIASGTFEMGEAEGKKGRIITSLTAGESIDFVTRAGAGGKILSLMESRRAPIDIASEESTMTETEVNDLKSRLLVLEQENQKLKERELLAEARMVVLNVLEAAKDLHALTKERLARVLEAQAVIDNGAVDKNATVALCEAAIQEERSYVAAIQHPTGTIRGVGTVPMANPTGNLTNAFQILGCSESAAKVAAKGRN